MMHEIMKKYGLKQLKEQVASFKIRARNVNKIPLPPLQSYFAAVVHLVLNYFAFFLETRSPRNNDIFAYI